MACATGLPGESCFFAAILIEVYLQNASAYTAESLRIVSSVIKQTTPATRKDVAFPVKKIVFVFRDAVADQQNIIFKNLTRLFK